MLGRLARPRPARGRASGAVALGALAVAGAIGAGGAAGTVPGNNGLIAFESSRAGNSEIFSMIADGSGVKDLSNNSASDQAPVWSPDGSRIAFQTNRDGNLEIYVMNGDGSGQTNVTHNGANDFAATWS